MEDASWRRHHGEGIRRHHGGLLGGSGNSLRELWEVSGGSLGHLWGPLGSPWGVSGRSLGGLWCLWGVSGAMEAAGSSFRDGSPGDQVLGSCFS